MVVVAIFLEVYFRNVYGSAALAKIPLRAYMLPWLTSYGSGENTIGL